jgi:AcrR family transcriptional regulator
MARRNDHSREQLRDMALQAAIDIINTQGLQQLSARKVATAIGYAVGSLYLLFENLDDLILQVNGMTLADLHRDVAAVRTDTPEAHLLALAQSYLNFARQHKNRWSAIFEHTPEHYSAPDWHQQQLKSLFGLIEAPLRDLLPNADAAELAASARAIWGGVHGICILGFTGKLDIVHAGDMEALLDHLVKTYLAGLRHSQRHPPSN